MADLELRGSFDRNHLLGSHGEEELKFLITVRPDLELQNLVAGSLVGTNVCLLFDISQSMEERDKLDHAIAAGRELVDLAEGSTISIVAFDDEAYVLGSGIQASKGSSAALYESLEGLRAVGGGMTNIAAGLTAATEQVQKFGEDGQAKVIILLSDGEDNCCKPDAVIAALTASDADIQLYAVGIGEDYEADFLKALVTQSNGRIFGHTEVEQVKEAFIDLAVTLANVVATQATLELSFGDGVLVSKGYKASPDQLFLGNSQLLDDRRLVRRVGNIERNKEYAFLYELRVPKARLGEVETVQARIRFDVPALGLRGRTCETRCPVTITSDSALATQQDGAVLETYRRVQITELVELFVDAHRAGRAEETARYLELLVQKYDDVNDQKMVRHYQTIKADLLAGGIIGKAMINASVVSSTVVRGGGELPVLIDDAF
jgi:hypothetical protein